MRIERVSCGSRAEKRAVCLAQVEDGALYLDIQGGLTGNRKLEIELCTLIHERSIAEAKQVCMDNVTERIVNENTAPYSSATQAQVEAGD